MIKKTTKILLFLALLLLPLTALKAAGTKTGEAILIPKEEIVSGNLYAAGTSITVDGNISGDLVAVAQSITVNGRVEGDIIAAGQDITVNGEVGGNIRVAGSNITINGPVARNVNAFGANIILGPDSRIGWDAYVAGSILFSRGTIDGGLGGYAGQALITGKIGKNVDLKLSGKAANKLTIASGAIINGDINYTSDQAADISNDASVAGNVKQETPAVKTDNLFWPWVWGRLFAIFAAIAVGLVMTTICQNCIQKIIGLIEEKKARILIPGVIIFFVLPPIVLVLMITVIGIPLALILAALWLIAAYVAKVLTAIFLGNLLIKKILKKEDLSLTWSLVPGVIILWLLFSIPFAGWVFGLMAAWLGLGGLWFYATNKSGSL
ncbi:MAG: hypothetical protein WC719_04515 [Patescibacteria group bacterium]|jgi:cytoskeletal protein CcmA (bactofilin family)